MEATRLENWIEFEAGPAKLGLHALPSVIADQIELESPPQPREETPVKFSFEVNDAASVAQRLKSLGVPVVRRPWGACHIIDPEGNIFGLHSADE